MIHTIVAEGLCGMEVVEVSPHIARSAAGHSDSHVLPRRVLALESRGHQELS